MRVASSFKNVPIEDRFQEAAGVRVWTGYITNGLSLQLQ
jgi:hypothetical protein